MPPADIFSPCHSGAAWTKSTAEPGICCAARASNSRFRVHRRWSRRWPQNDDLFHNAIFYLLTITGFVVVSGLTVPVPLPEAMQANELPLTHAMINCSAWVNHEPDDVEVAALACLRRDCRGENIGYQNKSCAATLALLFGASQLFFIVGFVVTAVGLRRLAIVEYGVPPMVAHN